MKITKLSKSAIECYKACEWQYFLQYICKIQTPGSLSNVSGNIVHSVAEILAKQNKNGKINNGSKRNDPYWLLDVAFDSYVRKNPSLNWSNKEKNACRKHLDFLLNSLYNPMKLNKIIGVEQRFDIYLEGPEFRYRDGDQDKQLLINGYIDLIHEIDKDTIEIVDYKTGKYKTDWATGKVKTQEDFEKDLQLRMYYYACTQKFPQYKNIILTLVYTALGEVITVSMGPDDVEAILTTLRHHFFDMKTNNAPTRLIDDQDRRGQHFKCKNVCYFGKTRDSKNQSLCKKLFKVYNQYGIADSPPLIQLTHENEKI